MNLFSTARLSKTVSSVPSFWILDFGSWILDLGYWIFGTSYLVSCTRYLIPGIHYYSYEYEYPVCTRYVSCTSTLLYHTLYGYRTLDLASSVLSKYTYSYILYVYDVYRILYIVSYIWDLYVGSGVWDLGYFTS